jgi:arginase
MGVGMGRGPIELLDSEALPAQLRDAGYDVDVVEIDDPTEAHEVGRIFEVNRELASAVRAARTANRVPLLVAGNCNVCVGAIGGIESPAVGIVWLDAHPDFHTPETTNSGFLDGMGLAIATGACWDTLARSVAEFHPVEERNAILVGVRDVDPAERERLAASDVKVIEGGRGPGTIGMAEVERASEDVAGRVDGVYLHLDFDSLDPSLGRANEFAAEGGLGIDDVRAVISSVAERTAILATSLTAYDPGADPDGRFGETAREVVQTAVEASLTSP